MLISSARTGVGFHPGILSDGKVPAYVPSDWVSLDPYVSSTANAQPPYNTYWKLKQLARFFASYLNTKNLCPK